MTVASRVLHAIGAALATCWATSPLAGQDGALVGELSLDSVRMADVFELRVPVPVPAGTIVYFPDTLSASDVLESFAPVEWHEATGEGGGATVTLTYRLIPFGTGRIPIPDLDAVLAPVGPDGPPEGTAVTAISGGSFVGMWDDGRRRFGSGARRLTVSSPSVRVTPVQSEADLAAGVQPRGPDDVVGLGWSWPNLLLFLVFSSVIAGAGVTASQDWVRSRRGATRSGVGVVTADAARREALAELDRLLREGPYASEHEPELYASSSAIVRRYAASLDPDWGPALTSSELMRSLASGRHPNAANDRVVLETEMERAERVKFGRLRSGPGVAKEHLGALRASLGTDAGGGADA